MIEPRLGVRGLCLLMHATLNGTQDLYKGFDSYTTPPQQLHNTPSHGSGPPHTGSHPMWGSIVQLLWWCCKSIIFPYINPTLPCMRDFFFFSFFLFLFLYSLVIWSLSTSRVITDLGIGAIPRQPTPTSSCALTVFSFVGVDTSLIENCPNTILSH